MSLAGPFSGPASMMAQQNRDGEDEVSRSRVILGGEKSFFQIVPGGEDADKDCGDEIESYEGTRKSHKEEGVDRKKYRKG